MGITEDIERALQLLGGESRCRITSHLGSAQKALSEHGLALAVVSAGRPTVQISSAQLVMAAIGRAVQRGEPEKGLQARIAQLCELSQSQIARALPTDDRPGQELGPGARARLEAHLLDPVAHPLPALPEGRWRPGLEAIKAAGNGWPKRRERTSRGEGEGP